MIDFHCHILPGLDDGPATIEESIAMAYVLRKMGFDGVYCTPHLIKGCHEATNESVFAALHDLREQLRIRDIDLVLLSGREYRMDEFLFGYLKDPLPLAGTNLLMMEIPDQIPEEFVKDTCFRVRRRGFTPMIAHPERCYHFAPPAARRKTFSFVRGTVQKTSLLTYLTEIGCAFQANFRSFYGLYGPNAKQSFAWLASKQIYTHFGTDLHSATSAEKLSADNITPNLLNHTFPF